MPSFHYFSDYNPIPMSANPIFEARREAKWQFRRALLLAAASMLEQDASGDAWNRVQASIVRRGRNSDRVIRRGAIYWRQSGSSADAMARMIRLNFGRDTPEGPARHRLQDKTEAHPFACIISENIRAKIYEHTYGQSNLTHLP